MIDIICYIPDLLEFRAEAKRNAKSGVRGFTFGEGGALFYNISKIPVYYNGLESLCLLKLSDEELMIFSELTSCRKIGTCESGTYKFLPGGKAIYERVYDTSTRIIVVDGEEVEYTPPYMIGVFA